ncbi:hypothetical protein NXS19_005467 [Fusarium pseudograminearum]|nr:hypothetical protein NXS19_005467 [Fusarium pseudograminearum]
MPHSLKDVIGGKPRKRSFESQFPICTNLAGIANALARNYRQDGGAETSKRLRTPRSIHVIHPILLIKGLVEGGPGIGGRSPRLRRRVAGTAFFQAVTRIKSR